MEKIGPVLLIVVPAAEHWTVQVAEIATLQAPRMRIAATTQTRAKPAAEAATRPPSEGTKRRNGIRM